MAVTSISDNSDNKIATIATYVLGVLGVALIVFFAGEIIRAAFGSKNVSLISVKTLYGDAEVFVNDAPLGRTPIENKQIKSGTNKVTLKSATRTFDTSINFLPVDGNKTIHVAGIVSDLGTSDEFSFNMQTWYEKGGDTGLRVLSEPSGAVVSIDGNEVGKTPYSSSNISDGDYDLKVALSGFESAFLRIAVRKGVTLNTSVKLFPMPTPVFIKMFEGSQGLYNLSVSNAIVTANPQNWAMALKYWSDTRGINLDANKLAFDYMVDYKGNIYDAAGNVVSTQEGFDSLKEAKVGAYLGKEENSVLTKEASEALQAMLKTAVIGVKATVKTTPTGWLRVREIAGLNGKELARVDTGGVYDVLEQQTGWVKIQVSSTVSGWVSADYVTVK